MSDSPFTRFARLGRRTIVLLGLGLFSFGAFAGWVATHVVVQGIGRHESAPPRLRATDRGHGRSGLGSPRADATARHEARGETLVATVAEADVAPRFASTDVPWVEGAEG